MLNAVLAQQEQPRSGPHGQGPSPGVRLPVGGGCQARRKGKPSAEVEAGCTGHQKAVGVHRLPTDRRICFYLHPDS